MKVLGVAGGTASGKTTFARLVMEFGTAQRVSLVPLDNYYNHRDDLTFEERCAQNYDHPDAFDVQLLLGHLAALRDGRAIEMPRYNFSTHLRDQECDSVRPTELVVVEGILTFHWPELRDAFNYRVFIDTNHSLRYTRRLSRDVRERGRTPEGVKQQWDSTVFPMHVKYCQPTKSFAHRVLSGEGNLDGAAREVISALGIAL